MNKTIQFANCVAFSSILLPVFAFFVLSGAVVHAQALPAAEAAPISTGFSLPTTLGTLQYAVNASESLVWGYYGTSGPTSSTNISGDLAYLSSSRQHPFSMVLTAGHSFGEFGQPGYSFVGLSLSQVANIGRWNFVVSDSINYLPGTPAAGLSGISGLGDLGVNPVQVSGDTGQGLLTNYSNRISNDVVAGVSRQLTGRTSINASGSYQINRFLDNAITSSNQSSGGLDSDSYSGQGGITHQMNPRSSISGNYSYSKSTYPNDSFGVPSYGFVSQTASGVYSYRFNRKLSFSAAAGPQWTTVQGGANSNSTSLFADVSANYAGKRVNSSLVFVRSTNNGFGVIAGGLSDSVVLSGGRTFDAVWNVAGSASYTGTSNLAQANLSAYSANTYVESIQVSRAIVRNLSGFISYSFEDQSSSGLGSNVDGFSGRYQVLGFGLTYSPAALHLGRP
jgi:hypothetical protein